MAIPKFGQMKELYQMQKKAKKMQKELKAMEIEASSGDDAIKVVVSGEMKIISIAIDEDMLKPENKTRLENALKETISQAMSKAQQESATRMQPLLKDMNLPGFGG